MARGPLRGRPILLLVTGRRRLGTARQDAVATLFEQVRAGVAAGVDLIQVREPDLPDQVLLEVATRCVDLARGSQTVILVNDRIDIALAAGAGGVHLRARSVPAPVVRRHVPAGFLLGRRPGLSCAGDSVLLALQVGRVGVRGRGARGGRARCGSARPGDRRRNGR